MNLSKRVTKDVTNRLRVVGAEIDSGHSGARRYDGTAGSDALEMKVTETRSERESAFRLVHEIYLRSGLSSDNLMGMRVMKHHLVDTTDVLIAKRGGNVEFSVTLVRDGIHGVPADSLFADKINAMRSAGIHLAEVSCVASASVETDKKARFDTFVRMIGLTIQTARRRGIDRLLLAVHPRHAKLYKRMFGCVACSDIRQYEAVQGNPAVLCTHDFAKLDISGYSLYDQIYGTRYHPWQLDGTRMSEAEKIYFGQAIDEQSSRVLPMAA